MADKRDELLRRIVHFQEINDFLDDPGKKYYLETEWYDSARWIDRQDILKEIASCVKNLEIMNLKRKQKTENIMFAISMVISAVISVVTYVVISYLLSNKS